MSKIIASAAIRGAHKIIERTEKKYKEAIDKWGPEQKVEFPNTAYYLPIIYGILGIAVKTLGDMEPVLERCRTLLPPFVREKHHLPYLGPVLDAGMATFFAEEIIEAIRYLEEPNFYTKTEEPKDGNIWLGAADDVVLRKRGIEFVDGSAPGFAAIPGAAPNAETAAKLAQELQQKNLYVFMCAEDGGKRFAEQLIEKGVQIGWPTRLVPFGPDISAAVFAVGFATRAALSFGGMKPGDYRRILIYNKDRIFAFVMALGEVSDEWYANAAGAINWGFPTIADSSIPQILPTGICTYEHVVSGIPHNQIVSKSIEVRGLKVTVAEVPVPVPYGPAFEGERVRKEDLYAECRGGVTAVCEWTTSKPLDEVEDGNVEVIGQDLDDMQEGTQFPLAIVAEVAGRQMQEDFEPILERQIHYVINYAHGVMHIGQRDIAWIRISKEAKEKGFKLKHIGLIIHAKFHEMFGRIFDKVQVKLYTREEDVKKILEKAKKVYAVRDARIEGMTDETTDTYYSCTLCVPKGEEIVLADGSFDKIENIIERTVEGKIGNVVSFQGHRLIPKPIEELFINPAPQKLIKVTLRNNTQLKLTPNHKVLLDTENGLVWRSADKLRPGDRLLSSNKTLIENYLEKPQIPYLIDFLPDEIKVFDDQFLQELKKVIIKKYKTFACASREIGIDYHRLYYALYLKETPYKLKHPRLSLGEIKAICQKIKLDWEEVKKRICMFGVSCSKGYLLKKLILDEEVMYAAGLIASDGSVVQRGKGMFVQFTNTEPSLVERFNSIQYSIFGISPKTMTISPTFSSSKGIEIQGKKKVMVSYVHNTIIGRLMQGLGIGLKNEKGKWSGEKISSLSSNLVASFLKGLFDGDGHVTDSHILISTGSYQEAEHIFLLLKKLGISSYITKTTRGYQVGTRNFRDYKSFRKTISSNHPRKKKKMEEAKISFDKNHVVRADSVPFKCRKLIEELIGTHRDKIKLTCLPVDFKTIKNWIKGKSPVSKEKLRLFLQGLKNKIDEKNLLYRELLKWANSNVTFEKIKNMERIEYSQQAVYNFSVKDTHNYLVNGIVVKNCQSFAPSHVCMVSPERTGLCGAYNWMDCRASYEINPTGPNQPVEKGEMIDTKFGQWKGVNDFVYQASRQKIDHYNFYSIVYDPMTTCGCCECICAVLPLCNGVMTVSREYMEMTPCGMKFTTLAGTIGGGLSTPGFVGHSKYNICQRKFILGDGGIKRIVWMPKMLKEEIAERLKKRSEEIGIPNFPEMIADETIGTTEEQILPFLKEKNHPALKMEPILGE